LSTDVGFDIEHSLVKEQKNVGFQKSKKDGYIRRLRFMQIGAIQND
jgi:hypothetical protein